MEKLNKNYVSRNVELVHKPHFEPLSNSPNSLMTSMRLTEQLKALNGANINGSRAQSLPIIYQVRESAAKPTMDGIHVLPCGFFDKGHPVSRLLPNNQHVLLVE